MAFDVTSEKRDDYLFMTVIGPVTEGAIITLGSQVREQCEAANVNGIVIDCSGMIGALPIGVLYSTTPQFVEAVGPRIRVAYINPPPEWRPEDDQFSRNVAQNRGGRLELFDTEEEASEWLSQGSASE